MAGTIVGGKLAAETNKKIYGEDFYKKIGAMGGAKSTGGGFALNPELAREAGRKGGLRRKGWRKESPSKPVVVRVVK